MINWIRHKLHNFIFPSETVASKIASVREHDTPDIEGMRFSVMVAEGGTIVQMRTYDRRRDESHNKTYVIPDTEQDIAHRIGQIVSLEMMKL
jgi:hypothetical protein